MKTETIYVESNTDYLFWKSVRKIIDSNDNYANKLSLKQYCLKNKDLFFNITSNSFQQKIFIDNFNVPQKKFIWAYLVEFHPEKVKEVLEAEANKQVALQAV